MLRKNKELKNLQGVRCFLYRKNTNVEPIPLNYLIIL